MLEPCTREQPLRYFNLRPSVCGQNRSNYCVTTTDYLFLIFMAIEKQYSNTINYGGFHFHAKTHIVCVRKTKKLILHCMQISFFHFWSRIKAVANQLNILFQYKPVWGTNMILYCFRSGNHVFLNLIRRARIRWVRCIEGWPTILLLEAGLNELEVRIRTYAT